MSPPPPSPSPAPSSGASLTELALDVVSQTDVDALLARLAVSATSATGLRHAAVVLDGSPPRRACSGPGDDAPGVVQVADAPAVPAGPFRLSGGAADDLWQAVRRGAAPVRCLVGAPVLVDGRPRGVVCAADERADALGEDGDQAAASLTTLTDFAGVMLGHLDRLAVQRAAADQETAAATAKERERMRAHVLARVIDAQEAERARVARDLHDQIGQALTSVLLGLHLVDAAVTEEPLAPGEAARHTAEVRELVADALRDVRRLAFDLRPTLLDDVGLVAALHRLATDLEHRHRTPVDMSVDNLTDDVRLRPELETVAYRVVQESLTNVIRHSGASTVSVRVEHRSGVLRVAVADDGVGFDPQQVRTSLGLRGMEERAALVGGSLVIDSAPGRGATVVLEVPLG